MHNANLCVVVEEHEYEHGELDVQQVVLVFGDLPSVKQGAIRLEFKPRKLLLQIHEFAGDALD